MSEERWQVTVRVPIRLPDEQREALFNRVADVVSDWESSRTDGVVADMGAGPAGDEAMLPAVFGYDLALREAQERLHSWAGLMEETLRLDDQVRSKSRIAGSRRDGTSGSCTPSRSR